MTFRENLQSARGARVRQTDIYHQERRDAVQDGDSLLDTVDVPGCLLHVTPSDSFTIDDHYRIEVEDIAHDAVAPLWNPLSGYREIGNRSQTASGIVRQHTIQTDDGEDAVNRYVHVSTTGIIESVNADIASKRGNLDGWQISASTFEAAVVSGVQEYTQLLVDKGLSGPFDVHLSMFSMKDVAFVYDSRTVFGGTTNRFDAERVEPYPMSVDITMSGTKMWEQLRPLLASVWRAAGNESPYTVTEDGGWTLQDEY